MAEGIDGVELCKEVRLLRREMEENSASIIEQLKTLQQMVGAMVSKPPSVVVSVDRKMVEHASPEGADEEDQKDDDGKMEEYVVGSKETDEEEEMKDPIEDPLIDYQMASSALICETEAGKGLRAHVDDIKKTHLRELMRDEKRCQSMMTEFDGIVLDYSRQCATLETLNKLYSLAEAAQLKEKIKNFSERTGAWVGATDRLSDLEWSRRFAGKSEQTSFFPVAVAVAAESKIYCCYVCKEFRWRVQGTPFAPQLLMLQMMILQEEAHRNMQIFVIDKGGTKEAKQMGLEEYRGFLAEHIKLPPDRAYDHSIVLKEGTHRVFDRGRCDDDQLQITAMAGEERSMPNQQSVSKFAVYSNAALSTALASASIRARVSSSALLVIFAVLVGQTVASAAFVGSLLAFVKAISGWRTGKTTNVAVLSTLEVKSCFKKGGVLPPKNKTPASVTSLAEELRR